MKHCQVIIMCCYISSHIFLHKSHVRNNDSPRTIKMHFLFKDVNPFCDRACIHLETKILLVLHLFCALVDL